MNSLAWIGIILWGLLLTGFGLVSAPSPQAATADMAAQDVFFLITGGLLTCLIGFLGLKMTRATVETLLDRAPEGITEKAEAAIRAVPGVVDIETSITWTADDREVQPAAVDPGLLYPIGPR